MGNTGADKQGQLLADIEEFSRNGPRVSNEPAKPELHRETLAFPDLNKAAIAPDKSPASPAPSPASRMTATPGGETAAANSLLARLKQQAQSLQQDAGQRDAQMALRGELLSATLGAAFHYLDDLVKQLNIIKPPHPKEFVFPGNILFDGMGWIEGAVDYRMVPSATEDRRYESVSVRFRIAAPRHLTVERDTLAIDPLRKLLHDYGIAYEIDEKLNERNQPEHARFRFPCEIKAGFLIKADYAAGNLILRTRNIDRFGMMEFRLAVEDLHQETLDELAHLMLGEKSRFLTQFRRTA